MKINLKGKEYEYQIVYKKKKNISFTFKDGILYVLAPRLYPTYKINDLLIKNENRLVRFINKSNNKGLDINENDVLNILNMQFIVKFDSFSKVIDNYIYLNKKSYKSDLVKIVYGLTHEYIEEKTKYYCHLMYGYKKVPNIKFKVVKGYHGQYNKKKNQITYNIFLGLVKKEYIDYVIVHELAHMTYMDHKEKFHNLIESYLPNHRYLSKMLRKEFKMYDGN